MEEQQNLGELIKIRREKLAKLIEEGHNPFEVVRFDKDAYADAIKKRYADYEGKRYGTYDKDALPDDIEAGDHGDRAAATVTMVSQPASVALARPEDGLYQTDGMEAIDLTWIMSNLDVENGGQFELYVASTNAKFHGGQPLSVTELTAVTKNDDGSYS